MPPKGPPVPKGTKLYRVWGGKAGPWGRSWTPVDPRSIIPGLYRDIAGLPDVNSGQFLSEGTLLGEGAYFKGPADPLDGNVGGLMEVILRCAEQDLGLEGVSGLNPEF